MHLPPKRRSLSAILLLVTGGLVLVPAGTASAVTVALAGTHMAASPGANQPATVHYPSGVKTVYFDYSVVTPSDETGTIRVYAAGGGQLMASAGLFFGASASLYVSLQASSGAWPAGGYCTFLYVDGTPYGAGGQMPVAWAVGNAGKPSCGRPPRLLSASQSAALSVTRAGIYRVTGSYLQRHGISWEGVSGRDLALTFRGRPVPRQVSTPGLLKDDSYIQFYGRPVNTQFTTTAVYDLRVDPANAMPVPVVTVKSSGARPVRNFPAVFTETRRTTYEPSAPGDKWFYNQITAQGGPSSATDRITVPNPWRRGRAGLTLSAYGVTNLSGHGPQHDVKALLNGHRVLELTFSGNVQKTKSATFPASWLRPGRNAVRLVLPGTVKNAYNLDVVDVQTFSISYRQKLQSTSGALAAALPADRLAAIGGFHTRPMIVWQTGPNGVTRLRGVATVGTSGGVTVRFVTPARGDFVAVPRVRLLRPASVRAVPSTDYLVTGHGELLVVAPRVFWPGLRPLVQYHRGQGQSVKLADIGDVMTRYGFGMFSPWALRTYINAAKNIIGTRSVLLVGGDTYDYHHYLDCSHGSCPANPEDVSLVPSLYTDDSFYGEIPSDELMVERNGAPRLAIGRIPAVTEAQVTAAVSNTMRLLHRGHPGSCALMASGTGDASFQTTNQALADQLPAGYSVTQADETAMGHKAARQALLQSIRSGCAIEDFVGHGNLEQWSQNPLLSVEDMSNLHPQKVGQMYFGWGCQTAYDVDPTDRALNARLLFNGGAAITLGSTGLDLAQPQAELAQAFFHELFHDANVTTVGQALQVAEDSVAKSDPSGTTDPIRSYELFGDPSLPLTALRAAAT